MSERLLRDRDVAAMLGTTPGVAGSILPARGVCASLSENFMRY